MDNTSDLGSDETEFVGDLYEKCLKLFIQLWKAAKESDLLSGDQTRSLYKLLERFLLWGDGFNVTNGALGVLLAPPDPSSLRNFIVQLLSAIGHTLVDRFVAIVEPNLVKGPEIQDHVVALTGLLEDVNSLDHASDSLYHSQNGDSDSEASDVNPLGEEVAEIITSLATYVDCLCDSIPSIERLAVEKLGPPGPTNAVEQVFNHAVQAQSTSSSNTSTVIDLTTNADPAGKRKPNPTEALQTPRTVAPAEEEAFQAKMNELSRLAEDAKELQPQKQTRLSLSTTPHGEESIGVIGDAVTITQLAHSLYSRVFAVARDSPELIRDLCIDLGTIKSLLYHVRDQAHRDTDSSYGTPVKLILDRCFSTLQELNSMITKYEQVASSGRPVFFKRLAWASEQTAIRDLRNKFIDQQKLLVSVLDTKGTTIAPYHEPRRAILDKSEHRMSNIATSEIGLASNERPGASTDSASAGSWSDWASSVNSALNLDSGMTVKGGTTSRLDSEVAVSTTLNARPLDLSCVETASEFAEPMRIGTGKSKLVAWFEGELHLKSELGYRLGRLHVRGKFQMDAKVRAAFRRSFEMEDKYVPEVWLRAATWWLVKSRTICNLLSRDQIRRTDESQVSTEQAFIDLLKSSWILEEIVLDRIGDKCLDYYYREIRELASSLDSDLRGFRNTFQAQDLLNRDFALLESVEQSIEAKDNIPNATNDLSTSFRFFQVDIEAIHERILYRTFVDARLGHGSERTSSSRALYMLLLWMRNGESSLFISLCNLRGTVNLSRQVVPKDMDTILSGNHVDLMMSNEITFASQESEIIFLSEQDMIQFWDIPRKFFAAVKDSYPVEGELTVYKSPIMSYKEIQDMKSPRAVANTMPENIVGGELQVHESMLEMWWKTTRRLAVVSPPYAAKPVCTSHWLPLDHVNILVEGSRVTVTWSDCGQPQTATRNYNTVGSYVYNPNEPNRKIHLDFENALQARIFEDSLLFPTEMSFQVTLKLGIPSALQDVRIYGIFDANEADQHYYAITSTKKSKSGHRMTEIYFVYKDIDWCFKTQDNTPLIVDFPHLGVPLYLSTRPKLPHKLTASDVKPVFKEVTMGQRPAHLELSCDHDLVNFMLTLTGWRLKFFRAVPKFVLADTSHLIRTSREQHKDVELQLWEQGKEEGQSRMQLCVRLNADTKNRWITASLFEVTYRVEILRSKQTILLQKLDIQRGVEVDTKTMMAGTRGIQARPTTKKQWKVELTFHDISDHEDFLRHSGLAEK